jgi:magnesium transporter
MALAQHLVRTYVAQHPLEAARVMEEMSPETLTAVLSDLDKEAAHALHLMDPAPLAAALEYARTEEAGRLLRLLSIDAQLAVLPLVGAAARERTMATLDDKDGDLLERLLSYPRQTAAALVEYDTFRVSSDITAGEAIDRSRKARTPVRYYVYVTDRENRLVGVVSLKELLRAGANTLVSEFMRSNPARINATESAPEVVAHSHWRRFPMLPVVDADEMLVGVILYETIQKLREEGLPDSGWSDTRDTLIALSEVYWMGLSTALGSPPGQHGQR